MAYNLAQMIFSFSLHNIPPIGIFLIDDLTQKCPAFTKKISETGNRILNERRAKALLPDVA